MQYHFLSHPLNVADSGFPGEPTLRIEKSTRIADGDAYNSSILHLFNHFGTHYDAPAHFNPNGPTISELPIEHFIYEHPLLIDLPKGEALRKRDPQAYAARGCAFSINAAQYLLDHAPHLKAVGFDFISLASPSHPDHGVKAHQILLGMYSKHYICIIEDMALAHIDAYRLQRVIAMPLRVQGVDSAQVSILAEVGETTGERS